VWNLLVLHGGRSPLLVLQLPVMPKPGTLAFLMCVTLYKYDSRSAKLMRQPRKKEVRMARGTARDALRVSSAMWPGTSKTRMRYCAMSRPLQTVNALEFVRLPR